MDFALEIYPHCVVEVSPDMEITWFSMYTENDTEPDPWRLD